MKTQPANIRFLTARQSPLADDVRRHCAAHDRVLDRSGEI
jgi:hypothetical protein